MPADPFSGDVHPDAPDLALLFCRPRGADWAEDRFEYEAHAAEELGIPYHVVPIEPVVNEEYDLALDHLPPGRGRRWLFRGWMLSAEEYAGLYEAMLDRGDVLVVSPAAHEAATYLPLWFPQVADHTFPSVWTEGTNLEAAWSAARTLGPPPWVVKDHVKSAKEQWWTASFVPEGVDRTEFDDICTSLLDARGDRFERGFVIRSFVPLERIPHPVAGVLIYNEHRLVFFHGRLVAAAPYNDEVDVPRPDYDRFAWLGERIDSPFFAVDIARSEAGSWVVVEVNDGGSITLPDLLDPRDLLRAIVDLWD